VGSVIARRPRAVWVVTSVLLGVASLGIVQLDADGLSTDEQFTETVQSVTGEHVLAEHFPAGAADPALIVAKASAADQVVEAAQVAGVSDVGEPRIAGDMALITATTNVEPLSQVGFEVIERLRDAVHRVDGADALVGGNAAIQLDSQDASTRDAEVLIPIILIAVLVVLMLLLRAIVAPLVLIATVVLSFGAALGLSALAFRHIFDWAGADASLPLFVFVFLVALGIDYNIFLMTRVREEVGRFGTRRGALIGLAATGGVITSAGLVLAGTFAVLGTMPVVAFAEIGFAVALGVLLDTIVVRSVLVTGLNLDIGRHMWWPSKLGAKEDIDLNEIRQDDRALVNRPYELRASLNSSRGQRQDKEVGIRPSRFDPKLFALIARRKGCNGDVDSVAGELPPPGAGDLAVDNCHRPEHTVTTGGDLGRVFLHQDVTAISVTQQVLVKSGEQEGSGRAGAATLWIVVAHPAFPFLITQCEQAWSGPLEGRPRIGHCQSGPPREVVNGRRAVTDEITQRQFGQCLSSGQLPWRGHPLVQQDKGLLLAFHRAEADHRGLSQPPQDVVAALTGSTDAGFLQPRHQARTREPPAASKGRLNQLFAAPEGRLFELQLPQPSRILGDHAGSRQLHHPSSILGRHEVQGASQRPRSQDLTGSDGCLNVGHGSLPHA